jgi:hypothetical protein
MPELCSRRIGGDAADRVCGDCHPAKRECPAGKKVHGGLLLDIPSEPAVTVMPPSVPLLVIQL